MEPSEAQYLIINALTTLDLLGNTFYDEDSGNWYINTLSQVLPIAMILQNGDIVPTTWDL
ncbi:hypothetical protein WKK05_24545 [Nostoc sp. UHCC 0302]|jgi:hypothetical protein|uniref:hypothetical protein n=1 Tax=Nostoc sp. UHCC 0302 TaxID=3134896 RepID=UPI00311CA930